MVFKPGRCVGMPEVYGRVLALARESLGVSQSALGKQMKMPASTISRLEQGATVLPVYYLDHVAIELTGFAKARWGEEAQGWEGHELHSVAARVGHAIAKMGFTVIWGSPKDLDPSADLFVEDAVLIDLVKKAWPEDERWRLGW